MSSEYPENPGRNAIFWIFNMLFAATVAAIWPSWWMVLILMLTSFICGMSSWIYVECASRMDIDGSIGGSTDADIPSV
jgi:hypothetical protein